MKGKNKDTWRREQRNSKKVKKGEEMGKERLLVWR